MFSFYFCLVNQSSISSAVTLLQQHTHTTINCIATLLHRAVLIEAQLVVMDTLRGVCRRVLPTPCAQLNDKAGTHTHTHARAGWRNVCPANRLAAETPSSLLKSFHGQDTRWGFSPTHLEFNEKRSNYDKKKQTKNKSVILRWCVCFLGGCDGLPDRMQHNHLARPPAHCIAIKQTLIKHTRRGESHVRSLGSRLEKQDRVVTHSCVCVRAPLWWGKHYTKCSSDEKNAIETSAESRFGGQLG